MKNLISLLLLAGILLLLNLLSKQFFVRMDLTENKQFTLSDATKDVLANLEEPVFVKAYLSNAAGIEKTKNDFRDLLVEYSTRSKGMVDFEIINPNESEEIEMEAQQNGMQPVLINQREADRTTQQRAYLGAVLESGDQIERIPFIQPGGALEYDLTTSIKKISVLDKPSVGFISGYGTAGQEQLAQAVQQLSILYTVENVDLNGEVPNPNRFRALALLGPQDSIPPAHLQKLSEYLELGGGIIVGVNAVNGDLQQQQGAASPTGVESWLATHGIMVEPTFLIDQRSGTITVQTRQGFFTRNTPMQFFYFPMVNDFIDHPMTKGLEQVVFPFMSPISFIGDTSSTYTPIMFTSNKSGTVTPPMQLKIQQEQWTQSEFNRSQLHAGAIVTKNTGGRLVVIGDGDFPFIGQGGDNLSLLINGIDWLADDTGLIELRTKGVTTRPLEELEDGTRQWYKMLNFLMPILLVIGYGIFRFSRRKAIRNRRLQEDYS